MEIQFFDEAVHLQTGQQGIGFALLALLRDTILDTDIKRNVLIDGCKRFAHKGIVSAHTKLLTNRFGHINGLQLFVNGFDVSVLGNQLFRRFLADTFDTRNVIGGIAHQRLDINESLRLSAVFLTKGLRSEVQSLWTTHFGVSQQNSGILADQLQTVAVTGGNKALMSLILTLFRKGTEDIVGLIALLGYDKIAQIGQQFLDERQLLCQLLRHTLALRFVALIHLMAEGLRLQVKSKEHSIRLGLREKFS